MKRILGRGCVEFPKKALYHLQLESGALVCRDANHQPLVEEDANGFLHDIRFGWRAPRYFGLQDSAEYELEGEREPDLARFDAIVISFLRSDPSLVRNVLKKNEDLGLPVVFIDGEDDPLVRRIYFQKTIHAYLKREVLSTPFVDRSYLRRSAGVYLHSLLSAPFEMNACVFPAIGNIPRIAPLSLTVPRDSKQEIASEKVYDISFVAGQTNPKRRRLFLFLQKYVQRRKLKSYLKLLNKGEDPVPLDKYLQIISASKVAVSAPGASFDTYRYWEIPCAGSAMATEQPFIRISQNFVDGESAIFYRSLDDLEVKLDRYLSNDRWEGIAKSGMNLFEAHHTYLHRASQIIKALG